MKQARERGLQGKVSFPLRKGQVWRSDNNWGFKEDNTTGVTAEGKYRCTTYNGIVIMS